MDCTGGTVAPARARTQFLATSEEATSAVNGCRPDGHATAPAELTSPHSRAKVTANRSAKGSRPSGPRRGNLPAEALLSDEKICTAFGTHARQVQRTKLLMVGPAAVSGAERCVLAYPLEYIVLRYIAT